MIPLAEKVDDLLVRYLAYSNYGNYVARMNLQGNERVLEVGCGGGNLSRFLARELPCGELTCIDSSEYWMKRARNRLRSFGNIEWRLDNILDFCKDEYFDAAILHYVLHDASEKEKVVAAIRGNLKMAGTLYVREPTRKSHGMASQEIMALMEKNKYAELESREGSSFPLRAGVFEGRFLKN